MIRHGLAAILAIALATPCTQGQCSRQWFPAVQSLSDGTVPGPNGAVYAVAVLANGDVVLGGDFTVAGDVSANHIVILRGQQWIPLGTGFDRAVRALAVMPNGDIIAGGDFELAGTAQVNYVARWNGSVWSALGAGVDAPVSAVAVTPSGTLFIGGGSSAFVPTFRYLARWDGSSWIVVGGGTDAPVRTLLALPDESVVVGGEFHNVGNPSIFTWKIARWTGSAWTTLQDGLGPFVYAVTRATNGDLFAVGSFTGAFNGPAANHVALWNGATWQGLGGGVGTVGGSDAVRAVLALPNGDVVVGGECLSFTLGSGTTAQQVRANFTARWDGSGWQPLGSGLNGYVYGLAAQNAQGDILAVGSFTSAQGKLATRIARYSTINGISPPTISVQPIARQGCGSSQPSYTMSVTASSSTGEPLRFQWRKNGRDLCDVPMVVDGANRPDLTLTGANNGIYEVVVFTEQGCVTSQPSILSVCYVDYDCSGQLTIDDLMLYFNSWFAGEPRADMNGDGVLTFSDLTGFINAWFRGCGY
jgi:hypothetical protein